MAKKSNYQKEDAELEKSFKTVAGKYSKSGSEKKAKSSGIAIVIISILLLLVIAGLVFAIFHFDIFKTNGTVSAQMTMAGVDITGMSYADAVKAVSKATENTYSQTNMIVKLGNESITLTPAKTNLSLDVEAAVKAACSVQTVEGGYFDLTNYFTLDQDAVKTELTALIGTVEKTMVPSTYEVTGETPDLATEEEPTSGKTITITVGHPGIDLNLDALYSEVMKAYSNNQFEVDYPLVHVEPTAPNLEEAKAEHCIEPVNAEMDSETFEVSQHSYGYSFNAEEINEALKTAEYGQVLQFSFSRIKPEKTYDDLYNTLFQDVLGEYTATNVSIPGGRDVNLRLSCEKIDGIVLLPGEIFDYNKALGERTPQAGWKKADGYVGMETVSEYGGGICQASSSLYYCALIADLEIVTRHCHGFISAYMPPGMDATVSWGGPHFRFKNNMEYPIKISAQANGGKITVKLLGTDTKDYYVKMEYEQYNYTWSKTEEVIMTSEEAKAKGYYDGKVICTPYNGSTVQTYKVKYDKETNQVISREKEALSIYNCRNYMICKIVDPEVENPDDTTDPSTPGTDPTPTPGGGTEPDPTPGGGTEPEPTPGGGTEEPAPTPGGGTEPTPTPGSGGEITEG